MNTSATGYEWVGVLAFVLGACIIPSLLVGRAAAAKKRSFWSFFFISFFFTWILGGIIVATMKKEN